MTLILCADDIDFYAVSDIAFSNLPNGKPPVVGLPTRGAVEFGVETHILSGLSQKTVIRNNTLILWSGVYVVALKLIRSIIEAGSDGINYVDINDVIASSGLLASEIDSVSIIYNFLSGNQRRPSWHNCYRTEADGIAVVFQGSGWWDFIDNTAGMSIDFESIQSRAVLNLWTELWTDNTLTFAYGGWFEITMISSELKFEKIPYALNIWTMRDSKVFCEAIIYSWYDGDSLCIANYTGFGGKEERSFHAIEDMLGNSRVASIPEPVFEPYAIHHIIQNQDRQKVRVISEYRDSQRLKMVTSETTQIIQWDKGLIEEFESDEFWDRQMLTFHKDIL